MPDRLALELTARLELRGVDWSSTRAFAHPADNQGYISLNRAGRERNGIVGEGEAAELVEQIREGLLDFRDPDGEPAVVAVDEVAERWQGDAADRLPDLVVRWRPTSSVDLAGPPLPPLRHGPTPGRRQRPHRQPHRRRRLGDPRPARGPPPQSQPPRPRHRHPRHRSRHNGVPLEGLSGEPLIER